MAMNTHPWALRIPISRKSHSYPFSLKVASTVFASALSHGGALFKDLYLKETWVLTSEVGLCIMRSTHKHCGGPWFRKNLWSLTAIVCVGDMLLLHVLPQLPCIVTDEGLISAVAGIFYIRMWRVFTPVSYLA